MWIEVVAAALVGLSLLWLVFEPVFTTAGARPADAIDMDALEDLEDTRSGVALAALKEIEFDRETGKLSDNDYEFLKQKYTVEALAAMRAEEDATPEDLEARVEAQVSARVATLRVRRRDRGGLWRLRHHGRGRRPVLPRLRQAPPGADGMRQVRHRPGPRQSLLRLLWRACRRLKPSRPSSRLDNQRYTSPERPKSWRSVRYRSPVHPTRSRTCQVEESSEPSLHP